MVTNRWWIAAPSSALKDKPVGVTILDEPLVVFRDRTGKARALHDRCPHRGYPLSSGSCKSGRLVCGYHGWAFDGEGVCQRQPAISKPSTPQVRVATFRVIEQDGYVWVGMGDAPGEPHRLILLKGAWQPYREIAAAPLTELVAQLHAAGWKAQPKGTNHLAPDRWEPADASFGRLIVHLVPETANRTRVEVLQEPTRWWDFGPLRFHAPKTGLPERLSFLQPVQAQQLA